MKVESSSDNKIARNVRLSIAKDEMATSEKEHGFILQHLQ